MVIVNICGIIGEDHMRAVLMALALAEWRVSDSEELERYNGSSVIACCYLSFLQAGAGGNITLFGDADGV